MVTEMVVGPSWGTWEELLLGGAVLRHGTHDWGLVAAELRARTVSLFTPEVCRAKYEDLRQQYCGCTALYEELRKKRITELKQALEVSEDSIGSLETRLEILNAERKGDSQVSYDSSRTESDLPGQKFDEVEFFSKETSKDGLSAGSFTQETRANWSPECKVPTYLPAEEMEIKPEVSTTPHQHNSSSGANFAEVGCMRLKGTLKGRRSKRKRKNINKDIKEVSVVESFLGSSFVSATICRENSTSTSGQNAGSSHLDDKCIGSSNNNVDDKCRGSSNGTVDDKCRGSSNDRIDDLMGIFNTIAENKCASVFRRRLDSQKRGRYKKMIMRHLDFDTIKSRIANRCVTSAKEVFRDLLLLANNALVFYSKTTREYKSALLLREIVIKSLKQQLKDYISRSTIALLSTTLTLLNPLGNPSNTCTIKPKPLGKVKKTGNVVAKATNVGRRVSNAETPSTTESLSLKKKGCGRTKKAGPGSASSKRLNFPVRGRKRKSDQVM